MMAFLGPIQIIALMAALLLVFGPDKMPEMGKQFGKALRELMKAKQEFMNSVNFDEDDHHKPYTPPSYDESYYNSYNSSYTNESDSDFKSEPEVHLSEEPSRTDFSAAAFADTDEFATAPAMSPKAEAKPTDNETKPFSAPSGTVARTK